MYRTGRRMGALMPEGRALVLGGGGVAPGGLTAVPPPSSGDGRPGAHLVFLPPLPERKFFSAQERRREGNGQPAFRRQRRRPIPGRQLAQGAAGVSSRNTRSPGWPGRPAARRRRTPRRRTG